MATTLTYTASTNYSGTISAESLIQWVEPRIKQRLLGVKFIGNHKVIIETLDGLGDLVPYRATVNADGSGESGARTAVDAWYNLLGSIGTLRAIEGTYDTGTLSNFVLYDIEEPANFLGDSALLNLYFARFL